MFGMSSTEFWEEDPQLYWAYRTFYLKKLETDYDAKLYDAWLKGNMNHIAVSLAINNSFGKQRIEYPQYDEIKNGNKKKKKKLTKEDINRLVQEEYNAWARY